MIGDASPGGPLFQPLDLGGRLQIANRIAMLALTRARAEIDGTPNELMAEYYEQRATAGLMLTDSCAVSPSGRTYLNSPGMYTEEHAIGWRRVTERVHAAGGKILLQINHTGRANNLGYLPRPIAAVAPSAIRIPRTSRKISVNIPRVTPYDSPRALETSEIELVVMAFARATELARWAQFDGVEIHADSGYLIHQFLATNTNQRSDVYGGSPQRRARFALEVFDAVCAVNGPEFVSIKFTPGSGVHDIEETDIDVKYAYLIDEINKRGRIAFLHLYFQDLASSQVYATMAKSFNGPTLAEGHLSAAAYADMIAAGNAEVVGFGRAFIANPDLVRRIAENLPLSQGSTDTYYSLGSEGYTDYPSWNPADPEGSVVGSATAADLRRAMNG